MILSRLQILYITILHLKDGGKAFGVHLLQYIQGLSSIL